MKLPFSVVKIYSQDEAEAAVNQNPGKWNVISLWSGGGGKHGHWQPRFNERELSVCQHRFHDIDRPEDGKIICSDNQIKDILAFARTKYDEPLIVHCYAGISRSSAVTLSILLDYYMSRSENPIDDALNALIHIKDIRLMRPNRHIVGLGIYNTAKDNGHVFQLFRELYNHPIWAKFW